MLEGGENGFVAPIGITMGCPVGVGPEIISKFFAAGAPVPAVVIGDIVVLERCLSELHLNKAVKNWLPGEPLLENVIHVLSVTRLHNVTWGRPDAQTGRAMAQYIIKAVDLIKQGLLSGMVTCPITKIGLHQAGYNFPGHTEMLASLCETENYAMMMAGPRLNVVLLTIHIGLAEVASCLDADELLRIIRLTCKTFRRDFGMKSPSIAVAGFNPHAGENGLFGNEEQAVIIPAVQRAREEGLEVTGPYPPDTIFNRAADGRFQAVICMYHDQGLIPFKLLHFADGVNVTIGLPIIRTSVDHGTAYDIAGSGVADFGSLRAAVVLADNLAKNRRKADMSEMKEM